MIGSKLVLSRISDLVVSPPRRRATLAARFGLLMISAYERAIACEAWTVSKVCASAGNAISSVLSVEYTLFRVFDTTAVVTTNASSVTSTIVRRRQITASGVSRVIMGIVVVGWMEPRL